MVFGFWGKCCEVFAGRLGRLFFEGAMEGCFGGEANFLGEAEKGEALGIGGLEMGFEIVDAELVYEVVKVRVLDEIDGLGERFLRKSKLLGGGGEGDLLVAVELAGAEFFDDGSRIEVRLKAKTFSFG